MKIGRNHESLRFTPSDFKNTNNIIKGKTLSFHSFCLDIFKPRVQLAINWSWSRWDRGLWRAYLKNGWKRGFNIFVIEGEDWIPIGERPEVGEALQERLKAVYQVDSLINKTIYRYAFNLACNFSDIRLKGKHCHHINGVEYIKNGDALLAATDDRACNIEVVSPQEHEHIHYVEMDYGYYDFVKESPSGSGFQTDTMEPCDSNFNREFDLCPGYETFLSKLVFYFCDQHESILPLHRSSFLDLSDDHLSELSKLLADCTFLEGQSLVLQSVVFFLLLVRLLHEAENENYHLRLLALDNFLSRNRESAGHRAFQYLLDTG